MHRPPTRAEILFTRASALPVTERGLFLALACGADLDLLAHLVALVAAHEGPDGALQPPAVTRTGPPEDAGSILTNVPRGPPEIPHG